jgi:hypothetical protein
VTYLRHYPSSHDIYVRTWGLSVSRKLKITVFWIYSETSVDFQRTTRRNLPEDRTFHNHRCENLKSRKSFDRSGERTKAYPNTLHCGYLTSTGQYAQKSQTKRTQVTVDVGYDPCSRAFIAYPQNVNILAFKSLLPNSKLVTNLKLQNLVQGV